MKILSCLGFTVILATAIMFRLFFVEVPSGSLRFHLKAPGGVEWEGEVRKEGIQQEKRAIESGEK